MFVLMIMVMIVTSLVGTSLNWPFDLRVRSWLHLLFVTLKGQLNEHLNLTFIGGHVAEDF